MVCLVLAGVILMDTLERSSSDDDRSGPEPAANVQPGREDLERILFIEQELEEIGNESLAIAYYGELAGIYLTYERYDKAGEATEHMAGLTGAFRDWKNAGDLYHEWVMVAEDEESIGYFAGKAAGMYKNALELDPSRVDVKTDLAIELMRLGRADQAVRHLEEVLALDPDYLSANFNLGVILHQMGNKDQSISYLKRSLDLAEGTEHEHTVRDFLQSNEMQNM